MNLTMTAPCHFGLEKTLGFELRRAGGENIAASDGRVSFTGDERVLIRANMSCSVAERIGVVLADFPAESFDDVFEGIRSLDLAALIPADAAFPVTKGQSVSSKLTSIPALQRTVKKALAEALAKSHRVTFLPESGAVYPVRFFLFKNHLTVYLDSSGTGLHKRGYREQSNAAPIKETLAAGLVDLARVKAGDTVIDPFCGSGTILIEAGLKLLNIAPCLMRRFACSSWGLIPDEVWREERAGLKAKIKPKDGVVLYGYDNDPEAVRLTLGNADKAGLGGVVKAVRREIRDFVYPDTPSKIITNPPYAERMLEQPEVAQVYREMGAVFLPRGEHQVYVISGNGEFERHFGEKAGKNRKLYNGMLECRYYSFTS